MSLDSFLHGSFLLLMFAGWRCRASVRSGGVCLTPLLSNPGALVAHPLGPPPRGRFIDYGISIHPDSNIVNNFLLLLGYFLLTFWGCTNIMGSVKEEL